MPIEDRSLIRFNAGLISPLALAREDLKRFIFSSEVQNNWIPRSLGSMMLRPGMQYIAPSYYYRKTKYIPYVFSLDDTAIIELTQNVMRVFIDEVAITIPSVSTAITNGTFGSDVSGWTDSDDAGCTSDWMTGGYMRLIGASGNSARRIQQVTVAGGDQNVKHCLDVSVTQGALKLRVGSTSNGQEYVSEQTLTKGRHNLMFTPAGNFYITLASDTEYNTLVDFVSVISAGYMRLLTPWDEDNLADIRFIQSGDVIFVACDGVVNSKIERHGTESWSIVDFLPEDGPFLSENIGQTTIDPSAATGNITLTASQPLFSSTHVGALFRITNDGQGTQVSLSGDDQYTDHIIVTGLTATRGFVIGKSGTWSGTLTLQKSYDEGASWADVATYTTNGSVSFNDALDNQEIWYRIGFKTGDYTSGTCAANLQYDYGTTTGIVRITGYTSSTSVSAVVLKNLVNNPPATRYWSEGQWSARRGYPTAVCIHEGRLVWAGHDKINFSVSDAYSSYDDSIDGDSVSFVKSIGSGPVDKINWIKSLSRLAIGGQSAEYFAQTSSLEEPLTATNCNIRSPSTQGSSSVDAVKVDASLVYVQASGQRLFMTSYDSSIYQYKSEELTSFVPEVGKPSIIGLAVQRQPDTRIHAIRSDGTEAVFLYDKFQELNCFVTQDTEGVIEDIFVMPGTEEDKVYYSVKRTINGTEIRNLERLAMESECVGGLLNKQADSFVSYSGVATTTVTAAHLPNTEVVLWADGVDMGTVTLDGSGQYTLASAVTNYVVGLGYTAQFKSAKMAFAAALGSALTQKKRIGHVGLILRNTHALGLKYGPDFDTMDDLPGVEGGAAVDPDSIWEDYDYENIEFPGGWSTDSRVCLQASAPRPCTVLGMVVTMQTSDKA